MWVGAKKKVCFLVLLAFVKFTLLSGLLLKEKDSFLFELFLWWKLSAVQVDLDGQVLEVRES
jgi:hypothetical protein